MEWLSPQRLELALTKYAPAIRREGAWQIFHLLRLAHASLFRSLGHDAQVQLIDPHFSFDAPDVGIYPR